MRLISGCKNRFWPSFTLIYKGVHNRLNDCKVPRSCDAKQAQIITSSPPCLTAGLWCLWRYALFGILPNMVLWIMDKQIYFVLICLKAIIPEVLWYIQIQLCKPKPCCHIHFKEKMLSPGNPSKQPILVHSFSNCIVMIIWLVIHSWEDCQLSWMFSDCE